MTPSILKVGGQALPDGVMMRTERAWAVARVDGSVASGDLPEPRWPKIPVIRVLASLVQGLRLAVTGTKTRDRPRSAGPRGWRLWSALAAAEAAVLCVNWLVGRLHPYGWQRSVLAAGSWAVAIAAFRAFAPAVQWRFHGAEHKAVTAYEAGVDLLDVDAVMGCSRVHPRCGTNLVAWLAVSAAFVGRLPGLAQVVIMPLALAVIAEILTMSARWPRSVITRALLAPGQLIQSWVTTREPTPAEQGVGCAALVACLERHHRAAGEPFEPLLV